MSKHSPFPWTTKPTVYGTTKLVDASGVEFGALFNKLVDGESVQNQNAAMVKAIPGLLMAAMRGHGWGDPQHLQAHPECTMCHAIRIAVGERTLDRVLELAAFHSDHILELLEECSTPEEGWREVEMLLGIAEGDPYCAERRMAGEYEGADLDIFTACQNA